LGESVSRERAQRRAARQAEAEQRQAQARRRATRSARWRRLRERILPRRRRTGRLSSRRNRAQFAGIAVGIIVALSVAWYAVDSWPERVAATVLALLALPAIVTLTLDRSTR